MPECTLLPAWFFDITGYFLYPEIRCKRKMPSGSYECVRTAVITGRLFCRLFRERFCTRFCTGSGRTESVCRADRCVVNLMKPCRQDWFWKQGAHRVAPCLRGMAVWCEKMGGQHYAGNNCSHGERIGSSGGNSQTVSDSGCSDACHHE